MRTPEDLTTGKSITGIQFLLRPASTEKIVLLEKKGSLVEAQLLATTSLSCGIEGPGAGQFDILCCDFFEQIETLLGDIDIMLSIVT